MHSPAEATNLAGHEEQPDDPAARTAVADGCARGEHIVLNGDVEKLSAERWVAPTLGVETNLPR